MTNDHEATRLAIMARIPFSAWSNEVRTLCEAKSGELLKSAYHSDTQGVLVYEVKYGSRPGYRTIVLSAPDSESDLHLVTNAFADMPRTEKVTERMVTFRSTNVLEVVKPPRETVSDNLAAMSPSDAMSPIMSYTFHVRSYGDHRVICSTSNFDDAKRIVAAIGNCGIFQFRDSGSYDDTTIWHIGSLVMS
jgi:hypothetical protein